jgi:hypothetical protein
LIKKFSDLCELCVSVVNISSQKTRNNRNKKVEGLGQSWCDSPIPSFQHGVLESGRHRCLRRIPHTWMPAIHAGMTKLSIFMFCGRA